MKTNTTYALSLATAQLDKLNRELQEAVLDGRVFAIAACTASIEKVTEAIKAFQSGDYVQGLFLMNAAADELISMS